MTMFDPMAMGPMMDRGDGMVATQQAPHIQFMRGAIMNRAKSVEAGRPVYDDTDCIRIQHIGERDFQFRPVRDDDKVRYREKWRQYCESRDGSQSQTGTPISVLYPYSPGLVETLRYMNVHTVEALASINDTAAQNIGMGALRFRKEAQEYLAAAEKGKRYHEAREAQERSKRDIEARDAKIAQLEAAILKMQQQIGGGNGTRE